VYYICKSQQRCAYNLTKYGIYVQDTAVFTFTLLCESNECIYNISYNLCYQKVTVLGIHVYVNGCNEIKNNNNDNL